MLGRNALIPFVLAVAFALAACGGSPDTGACVRGSGVTATCGDDFTAASCNLVNGSGFYEGKSCKELGFH